MFLNILHLKQHCPFVTGICVFILTVLIQEKMDNYLYKILYMKLRKVNSYAFSSSINKHKSSNFIVPFSQLKKYWSEKKILMFYCFTPYWFHMIKLSLNY